MTHSFRTPEDYELFLYSLPEQFPSVNSSTIVFIRRGSTLARVAGEDYLYPENYFVHIRLPQQAAKKIFQVAA